MKTQTLDKLYAAMKVSKGVPALESAVTSVLTSLNDGKKGHRDIAAHIIEDFSLTQKVLKLANSSMYAPFAKNADSITSALNVLGSDALLHVVLSTAIVTAAELEDQQGLSKTLLASELARNVCTDRAEDVSIAALMYDLGSLMIAKFLPQEAAGIQLKITSGISADKAEIEVLGMTLHQVGAEVAKRWKLPASIVSIIDGTGDPTLIGIAKFSNAASVLIHDGKEDEVQQMVSELDLPGIDKSKIALLIHQKLETMLSAPKKSEVQLTGTAKSTLDELFTALTQSKWKTVDALAAAMFSELSQLLKTAHCLLFMRTRSGDFGVRFGQGKGIDELRGKLRLSAQYQPTAFHAVITNNVDVSIADVSKLKPSALPDGYKVMLPNVNKFIILPIANGQVTGLVYCDWDSNDVISPAQLAAVKNLRDLFLPFFPS